MLFYRQKKRREDEGGGDGGRVGWGNWDQTGERDRTKR